MLYTHVASSKRAELMDVSSLNGPDPTMREQHAEGDRGQGNPQGHQSDRVVTPQSSRG